MQEIGQVQITQALALYMIELESTAAALKKGTKAFPVIDVMEAGQW